jgi:hypothetical protein
MRTVCVSIFIILFPATALFPEEAEPVLHKYSNQAGIAVGFTSGVGFSYRKWFHDKYGIQVTGFYFSRNGEYRGRLIGNDTTWWESVGIMGLYNFHDWKHARALLYAGTSYSSYAKICKERVLIDSLYYDYINSSDIFKRFTIGSGIGFDANLWRFGVNCMAGVRFGYSFVEHNVVIPDFTLETGVFYLF